MVNVMVECRYKLYNDKLRTLFKKAEEEIRNGATASEIRDVLVRIAKEIGDDFITTMHTIASAIVKLRTVSPLPSLRKVFRGFAGLNLSKRLVGEDERGRGPLVCLSCARKARRFAGQR